MSFKSSIKNFSGPEEIFEAISRLKVLVLGDVMIDSYLWGKVDRISPEAPVPIVLVKESDKRLGGAANVALNLQSLGATPILCSVIGDDLEGEFFFKLLQKNNLQSDGIVKSSSRITTVKNRVISGSHHMLRIDSEDDSALNMEDSQLLFSKIESLLSECDAVIFEDYDKGVITESLINKIVEKCQSLGIPTIVDPKKRNFLNYKGVSLFKPNKKELREGLKIDSSLSDLDEIKIASRTLKEELKADTVLITLSSQGVYIANSIVDSYFPAHKREICDVSGAGDTVISVAAVMYCLGLPNEFVAAVSNLAGGIVCEQIGVVPIDKSTLIKEIQNLNILNHAAGNIK